jgi:very-short-patch-repair endonuclease
MLSQIDQEITQEYIDGLSIGALAKKHNIPTRQITNALKRTDTPTRSQSDAQKLSLKLGHRKHPTEGKQRSQKTKQKISENRSLAWENTSDEKRQELSNKAKENWNNLDDKTKAKIHKAASDGIRIAAKEGSKLEKALCNHLTKLGYVVEYHKEQLIANEKMQMDLLLPQHMIAIEIDGPSHFLPIWGDESFAKTQSADIEKNGLLIQAGYVVLRIKNMHKNMSAKIARTACDTVLSVVRQCEICFPELKDRIIKLEI